MSWRKICTWHCNSNGISIVCKMSHMRQMLIYVTATHRKHELIYVVLWIVSEQAWTANATNLWLHNVTSPSYRVCLQDILCQLLNDCEHVHERWLYLNDFTPNWAHQFMVTIGLAIPWNDVCTLLTLLCSCWTSMNIWTHMGRISLVFLQVKCSSLWSLSD